MTGTTSTNAAAAGADFAQLSELTLALANRLNMEIIGCAKGFNAFSEGEIISPDCTAAEIERWLDGYSRAESDAPGGNVTRFSDVEFQRVMGHVLYRNWSLVADHTGVKILGPNFNTHASSYAEFKAFVNGFNAAGAALNMLGTGDATDQDTDGVE